MMKKREFIRGLRDGFPVCLGYFSVSVAFGMTAVLSGMPLWVCSIDIFDKSYQRRTICGNKSSDRRRNNGGTGSNHIDY